MASTGAFAPNSDVHIFTDGFSKLRARVALRCGPLNVPLVMPVTSVELRRAAVAAGGNLSCTPTGTARKSGSRSSVPSARFGGVFSATLLLDVGWHR